MKIDKGWYEIGREELMARNSAPAAHLANLQQRGKGITGALILDEVPESEDAEARRMEHNDVFGNTWAIVFLGTPGHAMVRIKDTMEEEGDQWEWDGTDEWCSRSRQPLDAWIFRPGDRSGDDENLRVIHDQFWCEAILPLLGHELIEVPEGEEENKETQDA